MSQSSQTQRAGIVGAVLLALSSLFGAIGGGIYAPLIATQARELGAPEFIQTAVVMALPSILTVALMLPVAIYADKSGRRKEIVVIALLLGVLFNVLLSTVTTWPELALYRTLAGIGGALMAPFGSLVILIAPEKYRGTFLAIVTGSSTLGVGIAQMFVGYIFTMLGKSYRSIYLLAAALTFIAMLLVLPVKAPRVQFPTMKGSDIRQAISARGVYWTAIAILIYLIGWNLIYPSLPIVLSVIYKAPPEVYSLVMGVISITLGLGTYIWGPVIDRWGGRRTLIFAILASAIVTFIMYPALGDMWAFVVLYGISTVFGVVGAPGTSYVASRSVKPELITVALTTVGMVTFLAGIISGFIAGPLIASLGLGTTILIAAIIELIGGIAMFGLPKV